MKTKVAIKSETVTPFGGIFYIMNEYSHLGMNELIDRVLGLRCGAYGYQYSEILSSLFYTYYCGGDHIEDIGHHLGSHLGLRPNTQIPSPDTVLRGIKELATENIVYQSDSGIKYSFNTSERLNGLLLDMLQHTNQLKPGKDFDLDFDHQFIPTEKYDTKYSYKKERGYFPGIATIGPLIVGLENRDGNANVRFHQSDTLKRIFQRLAHRGVFINRCRMDCGSYSKEIIATVHGYCNKFYIRASRYESLSNEISEITDWKQVELNFENYEVTSIPFTAFMEEENYRLVIQRKRKNESEDDLFDGKFVYRCIVTNDWDSTEEEIITFYNARGASEKKFDVMNNDFGWSKLPCSFLNENTAFLILTAIAANVYLYLIGKIAKVFTDLKPESRIKRFLFRFIAVPAKWIKTGRRWVLNIYSQKPYHLVWQT